MADAGYLRYEIAEYPLSYFMRGDNDVKVTMQDIATRCGVSKSLVSRVLNNDLTLRISTDTRTKIIEEIEKTGYIRDPNAQGLANKKGNVNPPALESVMSPLLHKPIWAIRIFLILLRGLWRRLENPIAALR